MKEIKNVWPGKPYPLGATWDGAGVNFALFSENAVKVELCLFEQPRRRNFLQGRKIHSSEIKDLTWFRPGGKEMTEEDWNNPIIRCLGLQLSGDAIEEVDDRGNQIKDTTLLILLNTHHDQISFIL